MALVVVLASEREGVMLAGEHSSSLYSARSLGLVSACHKASMLHTLCKHCHKHNIGCHTTGMKHQQGTLREMIRFALVCCSRHFIRLHLLSN